MGGVERSGVGVVGVGRVGWCGLGSGIVFGLGAGNGVSFDGVEVEPTEGRVGGEEAKE